MFGHLCTWHFLTYLYLAFFFELVNSLAFNSTALLLTIDADTAAQVTYMLNGYGVPYTSILVPQQGTTLPALESSSGGNFGLIVSVGQVQHNGTTALTASQWNSLYSYQAKYSVRMVHLDVVPSEDFGVGLNTPCCTAGMEQNVTLDASAQSKWFPTANLKTADMSTVGLYHYTAEILPVNSSTTTSFINFKPNSVISYTTTAGVINQLNGREQMAFFIESGNWSSTSTYLHHTWVQWGYHGLYQGRRRIFFQTQIDDLFLETVAYDTDIVFRLRPEDMYNHVQWTYDINTRLNPGSNYFTEFGFNANGNLIENYALSLNMTDMMCVQPLVTGWDEPTQLEYIKPLGTGSNHWPTTPVFDWSVNCIFLDPLTTFFTNVTQRDAIGLVSHTFTHLELNNATYHDALREIQFNLLYAEILNFTNAAKFSGSGLIPPAITGLHNGDAIRAWADNGLWNAIGDNTRPELRNPQSVHWPLKTTVEGNGYAGYQVTPRFATRVYYNCDLVPCNVLQWIDTEDGTAGATIYTLLDVERKAVGNQLLSLMHDPYMFHQPNIRNADVVPQMINGKLQKLGLHQMWVETIVAEIARLTTWPLITLKHDHIAQSFNDRMARDMCNPIVQYNTAANANQTQSIVGFTVTAGMGNNCEVEIPVTIPGSVQNSNGARIEQLGTDTPTLWIKLDGAPQSFTLTSPIPLS